MPEPVYPVSVARVIHTKGLVVYKELNLINYFIYIYIILFYLYKDKCLNQLS
jgi:hypothetical protein